MKVMIRRTERGFAVYVPKKDLEEPVIEAQKSDLWGGTVTLKNGWRLELPDMPAGTSLPITVEARRLAEEE